MHLFILVMIAMYWLPTILAVTRHSPSAMAIGVLNFFLGWTIIGWIIALVWALAAVPATQQIVVHVDGSRATISNEPRA
jgi:hypothetical protein